MVQVENQCLHAAGDANDLRYPTIQNENGSRLAVACGSRAVGAGLAAWTCDSTAEQDWYIVRWDGHHAQIANAGSGFCLDVTGGDDSVNGTRMIQESCDSSASQLWYIASS